ncbi:hypothetical protein LDO32_04040 [Luteimonas sp. Y-2-2-4F]|nr:hypothetical protein [Luteimonas sp. Y-2-2-4F]MCD9030904.1 hypothetical protein [Luteimonas sp. Y-2-2-4F]
METKFKALAGAGALAIAVAAGSLAPQAPASAQATAFLYCFVSPNGSPGGPAGLCSSNYPSDTYSALFEVRNLPAGNYSFVWTNEIGQILPCTTYRCTVQYLGRLQTTDTIYVNYVDQQTGQSNTLARVVSIGGGPL